MRDLESRNYSSGQRADRRALVEITDLIDDGVYDAASVLAWEVQRDSPGDPKIWRLLTRIDYLRERYAAAMYAARMATRLDPSSADAWLWLARTATTRGRWRTEGLDAALQATALAPSDPQTWTALARLHLARDARYEAAIAAERAVRVGPTDADAHCALGEIAQQAGEWSHATAAYRRALDLDSGNTGARNGLAFVLEAQDIDPSIELGRYDAPPPIHLGLGNRLTRLAKVTLDTSDSDPTMTKRNVLLIGVGTCLTVGLVAGLAVPGLGAMRGLVAAVAVILMFFALWPVRRSPQPASPARPAVTLSINGASPPQEAAAEPPVRQPPPAVADPPLPAAVSESPPPPAAAAADAELPEDADDEPELDPEPTLVMSGHSDLPNDLNELAALSRARLAEFDLDAAREAASHLALLAPDSLQAHRALAAVSLAEQDYPMAELHYGKVLEYEPLDQEAHERLAMAKEGRRREQQPQRSRKRKGER